MKYPDKVRGICPKYDNCPTCTQCDKGEHILCYHCPGLVKIQLEDLFFKIDVAYTL